MNTKQSGAGKSPPISGRMRPASHHKIRATYALNNVLSFEHRMAGVEVDLRHGMGEMLTAGGAQVGHRAAGQLYFDLSETVPYNFGGSSLSLAEIPMDIPTGSWRSVHSATFRTAEEIVIDELARQMGQNPVEFRMRFLKTQTAKNVLRKVADAGRWGRAMPAGSAQGVAYHEEHRSSVACLVEINATNHAQPRVTKAVMAVDVGRAINPTGLRAQLSGGLHDGISTVLQAGLHIDKGAVREGSFSDFRWAKQRHSPLELELYVMPATGEPGHTLIVSANRLAAESAEGKAANQRLQQLAQRMAADISAREKDGKTTPEELLKLRQQSQADFQNAQRQAQNEIRTKLNPVITDIALEVGFADLRTFERAFHRHTGDCAQAFRKQLRLAAHLASA